MKVLPAPIIVFFDAKMAGSDGFVLPLRFRIPLFEIPLVISRSDALTLTMPPEIVIAAEVKLLLNVASPSVIDTESVAVTALLNVDVADEVRALVVTVPSNVDVPPLTAKLFVEDTFPSKFTVPAFTLISFWVTVLLKLYVPL